MFGTESGGLKSKKTSSDPPDYGIVAFGLISFHGISTIVFYLMSFLFIQPTHWSSGSSVRQ